MPSHSSEQSAKAGKTTRRHKHKKKTTIPNSDIADQRHQDHQQDRTVTLQRKAAREQKTKDRMEATSTEENKETEGEANGTDDGGLEDNAGDGAEGEDKSRNLSDHYSEYAPDGRRWSYHALYGSSDGERVE